MGIVATDSNEITVRERFRRRMPVASTWAYMDHAAVGPLPDLAAQAIQSWAAGAAADGDVRWPEWSAAAARLRRLGRELLHASHEDEIGLIPNTTFGVNVIAQSFPWQTGDSVVILENEFPSNMLPWLALEARGVHVRRVQVDADGRVSLDRIRASIDRTTRLVSVSWVGYATGHRLDLAALCSMVHEAGSQLFVDAIQGLGVFPLNTRSIPIDYAAADGHKWMLGPEGAGLLYIRDCHLEHLQPMMMGWGSIESSHEFKSEGAVYKRSASRYEGGSANHAGQIGFAASLQLLLELGCHASNAIAETVLENAQCIRECVLACGGTLTYALPSHPDRIEGTGSGIVSFDFLDRDPMTIRKRLLAEGIVLSVRHGHLRAAAHAYNDASDLERLERGLRSALKETGR